MKAPRRRIYIAHRREDGGCQELASHLLDVATLSGRFAGKVGLGALGELVGLLHDLGKYSDEFQGYLLSAVGLLEQDRDEAYVDPIGMKGKVDHSTAGAQALWNELRGRSPLGQVVAQVLSLCVASHHSGLIDCVSPDGSNRFSKRMGKPDRLSHLSEARRNADETIRARLGELTKSDAPLMAFHRALERICLSEESEGLVRLRVGLQARFLFSCLVDADRINTADFERPRTAPQRPLGLYQDWGTLVARLERRLAEFGRRREIERLRGSVSDRCLAAASRERGVFTLTVPTGGGKTLGSLRFALHHARVHRMDRVLYVLPFTTIIDQNAKVVREILEPPGESETIGTVVLEHHSNLTPERDNWRTKILSEDWDAPVVFTTNVQFLEALFGAGTRGARRMHSLAKAVIIFDEAQALPINCVHLFNNAVNFLVELCGSTVVLCTATQPLLDRVDKSKGAIRLAMPRSEIMPDISALFDNLKRVEILDRRKPGGWAYGEVADLAVSETSSCGSCLVVVNTKAAARSVFELCAERAAGALVFHLSASMCPAHRRACMDKIGECLGVRPLICVSTQLIEAGVDIDFASVVRFTAGLDSIAQAAGRCNRHKARRTGYVHVINPAEDGAEMLRDIRAGKEAAERVLDEMSAKLLPGGRDVLAPSVMERYFEYYFFDRSREMDYPVPAETTGRADTLLNMLGENRLAVGAAAPAIYLRQSFMTAARAFRAIAAPTRGIVVPYTDAGKAMISNLCSAFEPEKQLRQAQQFTVNVFPHALQHLERVGALHEVQEGTDILYLDSRYYHDDFGLTEDPSRLMEVLNA